MATDLVETSPVPPRRPSSTPSTGSASEHAELKRILGHFRDRFDEEVLRRVGRGGARPHVGCGDEEEGRPEEVERELWVVSIKLIFFFGETSYSFSGT